jgi:hypothetical protein
MTGIRARHIALVAFIFSACAGEGDPSTGNELGTSQSALDPVAVVPCGDQNDLHFASCTLESPPGGTDSRVWPGLFQVIGLNPDEGAGIQQVNETAFTFKSIRYGRPGSLTTYIRRISALTDPAYHDLVFDLVGLNANGTVPIPRSKPPPTCGYGILDNQLGRARFNLSRISAVNVDTKVNVNFTSASSTFLDPNKSFAVYVHLESPAKDRLGMAGTDNTDVYLSGRPYTRQARIIGASCLTNPEWAAVANRDVWFLMTVNDGCTAGETAPSCGQGICFRDTVPACDSYGNFQDCEASYCDGDNDIRCVPPDPDGSGPVTIDPNDYGCNVDKLTCFKRIPVAKTCTSNSGCLPQVPAGTVINPADYTCNLSTNRCNPPANTLECFVANDPICVPSGVGVNAANYGCDLNTNRCYTLALPNVIKETCNGLDDNCDGSVDNDLASISCGQGRCQRMEYTCNPNGTPFSCPNPDPRTNAVPETCNAIDDNCDGLTDNGIADLSCGVGECFVSGVVACPAPGSPNTCTPKPPSTESCDGRDQDCDGFIDNAELNNPAKLTRPYYPYNPATLGKGICTVGQETCRGVLGGIWDITTPPTGPASETCNAVDDNCDGFLDNAISGSKYPKLTSTFYTGSAASRGKGICHDGEMTCGPNSDADAHAAGVWWVSTPEVTPGTETCNGLDDDCNGAVDDGLATLFCGQGVCRTSYYQCDQGQIPAACVGSDPQLLGNQNNRLLAGESAGYCNGLDDDCDGRVDNKPGLNDALTRYCYTGSSSNYVTGPVDTAHPDGRYFKGTCTRGSETCTNGAWPSDTVSASCIGQVLPVAETCDNQDNDCNGSVDDGADAAICPNTFSNSTASKCGTYGATKTCVVKTCSWPWYDIDGNPANGCEVRDDAYAGVSQASPGNTLAIASCPADPSFVSMGNLPLVPDGGATQTLQINGNLPDSALSDHYKVTLDSPAYGEWDKYANWVSVRVVDKVGGASGNFKFEIFSSVCSGTQNSCVAANGTTLLTRWDWADTCAIGNGPGKCGTFGSGYTRTQPVTLSFKVRRVTGPALQDKEYTLIVERRAYDPAAASGIIPGASACAGGLDFGPLYPGGNFFGNWGGPGAPVSMTPVYDYWTYGGIFGNIVGSTNHYHYYAFQIGAPTGGNSAGINNYTSIVLRSETTANSGTYDNANNYRFDIFAGGCGTGAPSAACGVSTNLHTWQWADTCRSTDTYTTNCSTRAYTHPTSIQFRVKRTAGPSNGRYRLQIYR